MPLIQAGPKVTFLAGRETTSPDQLVRKMQTNIGNGKKKLLCHALSNPIITLNNS